MMLEQRVKISELSYENFECLINKKLKFYRSLHQANPVLKAHYRKAIKNIEQKINGYKKNNLYERYMKNYSFKCNLIG